MLLPHTELGRAELDLVVIRFSNGWEFVTLITLDISVQVWT